MRNAIAILGLLLATTAPAHAGQAFLDGDFTSWSFGVFYGLGPGGGNAQVTRELSGGNPGTRLHVAIEAFGASGVFATALKRDYVTTGLLQDATFVLSADVRSGTGSPLGIRLLLEQYGTTYVSTSWGLSGPAATFTPIGLLGTLNPGMFTRIDGPGPLQPDMTGKTPTRFGFVTGGIAPGAVDFDNVRLDLSVAPAPCFGFVDVADADAFCGAVGWLRNRSITLGCEAQQFCPGAFVTRSQMALFLARMGVALAPTVLYGEIEYSQVTVAPTAPGTGTCFTSSPFAVGDFPRIARPSGTISATASDGATKLQGYWMYTINHGQTWNAMGSMSMHGSGSAPGDTVTLTVRAPPMQLRPGNAYRFGIFVDGMGTASTFAPLKCQADVLVVDEARP